MKIDFIKLVSIANTKIWCWGKDQIDIYYIGKGRNN